MKKTNLLFGFYGAGSHRAHGNVWFEQLATSIKAISGSPVPLFAQNDSVTATQKLLATLDSNRRGIITEEEIGSVSIGLLGYSWGGIAATRLAQKFSRPGEIVVGGLRRKRLARLEVPIPIDVLITIDPVTFLNPPGVVPRNVRHFLNYFQLRGGDSVFASADNASSQVKIGNWLSRRLKGCRIKSEAATTDQIEIGSCETSRRGLPFIGNVREYILEGCLTGHDAMPWLAAPEIFSALRTKMETPRASVPSVSA